MQRILFKCYSDFDFLDILKNDVVHLYRAVPIFQDESMLNFAVI